jgi:hypothetical protein
MNQQEDLGAIARGIIDSNRYMVLGTADHTLEHPAVGVRLVPVGADGPRDDRPRGRAGAAALGPATVAEFHHGNEFRGADRLLFAIQGARRDAGVESDLLVQDNSRAAVLQGF